MSGALLRGAPASPGVAAGPARLLHAPPHAAPVGPGGDPDAERALAHVALAAAGAALEATAARLRADGRGDEADMVDAGALMAADPALEQAVGAALDDGLPAAAAIARAAEEHAALIAALPDEHLAARAGDVRSFGRRAATLAAGDDGAGSSASAAGAVLIADDLGPADVAELDGVAAIALARGGATAHAAIVARSLGLPLVVGLGDAVLAVTAGETVVVDGAAGAVTVAPDPATTARAHQRMAAAAARRAAAEAQRGLAAVTCDGRSVRVLANAAGAVEVRAGLAAGAEGVGLLRTELAFLDAGAWPTEDDHRRLLDAVAAALGPGRTLTVRLLDFGGDKTPPFLVGAPERGIALLLAHPDALHAQLRAIARCAGDADLRVLLPLVATPGEVDVVRAGLPPGTAVGAMIETPEAAAAAEAIASRCAFLSIGTNDLAHATLGTERFAGGSAPAHHPRVLSEIARTARAARAAGVPLEVCGEAASDSIALPLLVGLGVDELSAGAARVGAVRAWVRALDAADARALAAEALTCDTADAVAALVRDRLEGLLDEGDDERAEVVDRGGGVGAVGA
jgi:phosphoenolpyruvate-protein kinase (PTS system EI component)